MRNSSLTAIYNEKEIFLSGISGEAFISGTDRFCGCLIKNGSSLEVRLVTVEDVETVADSESGDLDGMNDMISSAYLFNKDTHTITGVEPETTIATIRNNIDSGGAALSFFDKNGSVKTSGVIGTGAGLQVGNNTDNRYYLVIYGELSGEGNINSSDKKILVNTLLGKQGLNGVYSMAGDVNGDSSVDLRDYVALDDYLKGQYKIDQKR